MAAKKCDCGCESCGGGGSLFKRVAAKMKKALAAGSSGKEFEPGNP